jgi:hypothetical protein
MNAKIKLLFLLIGIQFSCSTEDVNKSTDDSGGPKTIIRTKSVQRDGNTYTVNTFEVDKFSYPNLVNYPIQFGGLSGGVDQAIHGTIMYRVNNADHVVFTPFADSLASIYVSPIQLLNTGKEWTFANGDFGRLMDCVFTTTMINPANGTILWGNISNEREGVRTDRGNMMLSTTNLDNSLSWKEISLTKGYYANQTFGDLDGDAVPEIITFNGPSGNTEKVFILKANSSGGYQQIDNVLPTENEWLGKYGDLYKFDFGVFYGTVHAENLDETTPTSELVLPVAGYSDQGYSFIIMNYNPQLKKFEVNRFITELGLLDENRFGIGRMKSGDFDGDNHKDIIVSYGEPRSGSFESGIQIWYGDGKGNLTPGKSRVFTASEGVAFVASFEIGRWRNKNYDDIFLSFTLDKRIAVNATGVDLTRHLLVNDGKRDTPFTNDVFINLPFELMTVDPYGTALIPLFMKGYFLDNKLRVIGFRGLADAYGFNNTSNKGNNQFDFFDIVIP